MVSEPSLIVGRSPRIRNMLDSFIVIGMTANLIVVKATNPSHLCRKYVLTLVVNFCSNGRHMGMFGLFDHWSVPTAPLEETSTLGVH